MKNKRVLILGAVPMFLLGCNSMKQITDEKAIEVAGHILERQSRLNNPPPTNFKIVEDYSETRESLKYSKGKCESKMYQKYTCIMDFENKKLYEKRESLAEEQEGYYEGYKFYNAEQNKTHILDNNNGKKTRKEIEGPNVVEVNYSNLLQKYVFYGSYLETIEEEIKEQKEKADYYKDSKKNKYKYGFYSKDDRSLEEKVESKIFGRSPTDRYDYEENRNITYRFVNDVFELYEKKLTFNSKYDDDPTVEFKTNYETMSMTININYGNNKVNIPNIDDYKLEE